MKQLEFIDGNLIPDILKFYKDIGINLCINEFKNKSNRETSHLTEKCTEITFDNLIINDDKKVYDLINKIINIDDLQNLFKNFEGCNLKKTATNFVKFYGNKKSKLLFIDGTPDTEEDRLGNSFVSLKGDLFEKMLNAINLEKDDVFITKAIPWRPPGNRYPTTEEIKICRPFIFNLIRILLPKIIVCLGEVPTNQILNLNQSIIKTRGKWHTLNSNLIFNFDKEFKPYILPTLSISYLLKRPDMKKLAWEDMKLLRDKIKEI